MKGGILMKKTEKLQLLLECFDFFIEDGVLANHEKISTTLFKIAAIDKKTFWKLYEFLATEYSSVMEKGYHFLSYYSLKDVLENSTGGFDFNLFNKYVFKNEVLKTYLFQTHHEKMGRFIVDVIESGHLSEANELLKMYYQNPSVNFDNFFEEVILSNCTINSSNKELFLDWSNNIKSNSVKKLLIVKAIDFI